LRLASLFVPLVLGCGGLDPAAPGDGGGLSDEAPPPPCQPALSTDRSFVDVGAAQGSASPMVTLTNRAGCPSGDIIITASEGVTATGCNGPLAGGASCNISISATPTAPGQFSGTVSISANPGAITPLQVNVFGYISDGVIFLVSPAAFDLGPIPLGFRVPPMRVHVSAGMDFDDLVVAASGPDIAIDATATTCTNVLPAGQSCDVVMTFLATSVGSKSEGLTISGGGPLGKVVTVAITANVVTGVYLVVDASSDNPMGGSAFAGQASTPSILVVGNRGDTTSGLLSVTLTGTDAAEFLATSDCATLAPLGTCTVSVVFQPAPASTGRKTATLEVSEFSTSYSALSVPVIGIVVPP
jgi:hypothetical protein